ncbi:peptide ABC transporter permease, partial [Acinetobacter baumannii]
MDQACRVIATGGAALPTFVLGLGLIYVFYSVLGWAPEPVGRIDPMIVPPARITGFLLIDSLRAGDLSAFRSALVRLVLPAATM